MRFFFLMVAFFLIRTEMVFAATAEKIAVAVSLPPQAWLVDRISQGRASVAVALPQGGDPHTFEPSPIQIKRLSQAAVYVTVGMEFEKNLVNAIRRLAPGMRICAADAGIAKSQGHCSEHHCSSCGGDPHIWMSPPLFAAMATNTAGALRGLLPDAEIEAGLIKTVEEIAAAELEVRRRLTKNNVRTLLSYHSSYSYFAGHYGLRAMEIEHEGKAPSARRLAQVTREARACGVKRVLADVSSPRRAAETVARELDGTAVVVDPLRRDWILMMKEIASALSGD